MKMEEVEGVEGEIMWYTEVQETSEETKGDVKSYTGYEGKNGK